MPTPDINQFPKEFVWGAATSSYQIEGGVEEGGRGPSIWDTFCRQEGKVVKGEHGDIACDHYNRWPEDLDILQELGFKAYRFSVAWPRILPTGLEKKPLQAGIDFYSRLVDGMLERGLEPWCTLYHWDLPQALHELGGWPNRETGDQFVRYADIMSQALGDRVKHWITHNEPWVISVLGYLNGEHAPGHKSWKECLATGHHLLVSHAQAVPVIRANAKDCKVGITLNLCPAVPASPSAADQAACRQFDGEFNRWFLDPLYGRGYPKDVLETHVKKERIESINPEWILDGDMELIPVETDFLGINYYSRGIIRSDEIPEEENEPRTIPEPPKESQTDMGWEVCPAALNGLLHHLHEVYAPPSIIITENGAAYPTGPNEEGVIQDDKRIEYFTGHLHACQEAVEAGVPLTGYFAWSLLDNFEWAWGYDKRFGIVYVDYETLERTPKQSARWFQTLLASKT